MILVWTVLQPSARERRLRLSAAAMAAVVAAGLTFAAFNADPRHPMRVWSAAAVSAGAAAWALYGARRAAKRRVEVAVGDDGALQVRLSGRPSDGAQPVPSCVFVAPWLITLRSGAMLVPVWPDSMPPDAFRRLHACTRWSGTAQAATDKDNRTGNRDDRLH